MAPGLFSIILISRQQVISITVYFAFFTFSLYHKKYQKYYLIISIRSHFCKWPWRDWQPLYRVGCEVIICLCRCVGLTRSLLLDWYLGSQKLREILTLLYCITLSSSRENQRSDQEVARRISGAVAGEIYTKSSQAKTYHVPITTLIPRITLFAICLSFSSPPLHPCRFIRPLFPNLLSFACPLLLPCFCLPLGLKLGKLLSIWTIIITWKFWLSCWRTPYLTYKKIPNW